MGDVGTPRTLTLPVLSNGPLTIGDLWDIRTSTRVGLNLFGKRLTDIGNQEIKTILDVKTSERQTEDQLIHIKDSKSSRNQLSLGAEVSAEISGGFIKISGGLDFEKGWGNGMNEEELKHQIILSNKDVSLRSRQLDGWIDAHLIDLIDSNELFAKNLYVVRKLTLGGTLTGSIKISQMNTDSNYKVGVFVKGEIDLKIASAKLGVNVEIGEDIKQENYQRTIKLKAMPPIQPPVDILDFASSDGGVNKGDSKVRNNFNCQVGKENWFPAWKLDPDDPDDPDGPIGVPCEFELVPLSDYYICKLPPEEGGYFKSKRPEDSKPILKQSYPEQGLEPINLEEALNVFVEYLDTLRDWIAKDSFKRMILSESVRLQKLLSDPTHEITMEVIKEEQELINESIKRRFEILKQYSAYKRRDDEDESTLPIVLDDWIKAVESLKQFCNDKDGCLTRKKKEFIEKAEVEIKAVNVQDDSYPEEFENKSPLKYFTNETEIHTWLNTQRFCKILYKAPFQVGETKGIPQTLYGMSHNLGRLYIQPGIAYPTLTAKIVSRKGTTEKDDLFSIISPTQMLKYSEDEQDKINFTLDLLKVCTGFTEEKRRMEAIHLYNAYCELLGLKLNISATEDVIPLINLLQEMFGGIKICDTTQATKIALEEIESDKIWIVITAEGIRSSRHVIHTLLNLQSTGKLEIICGTFELKEGSSSYPDAPLLFIVSEKRLKNVCLDHLDLLVFLDGVKNDNFDKDETNGLLDLSKIEEHPLCSSERIRFAKEVWKTWYTSKLNEEKEGDGPSNWIVNKSSLTVNGENDTVFPALEIITAIISSKLDGPLSLANVFTKYVLNFLGQTYTNWEQPLSHWKESKYEDDMNETKWNKTILELTSLCNANEKDFPYFTKLGKILSNVQSFFLPPVPDPEPIPDPDPEPIPDPDPEPIPDPDPEPIPDPDPEPIPDPDPEPLPIPPPKTKEELMECINTDLFLPFIEESKPLKIKIDSINETISETHFKSIAKLFGTAIESEVKRVGIETPKLLLVFILIKVLEEISSGSKVSENLMHEVFAYLMPSFEDQMQSDLSSYLPTKRYYHVANYLADNSGDPDLCSYQRAMQKVKHMEDWIGIIQVIQIISPDKGFSIKTLNLIWNNKKFQHLIRKNIENIFIVKEMIKAFCPEKDDKIPNYIPSDIAKYLISHRAEFEGEEDGFEVEWKAKEDLIEALQIIWVRQNIPEGFDKALLSNVVWNEEIRKGMEEAGALFFWNKKEMYFEEPWDLNTIISAIKSLLAGEDKVFQSQPQPSSPLSAVFPIRPHNKDKPNLLLSIASYLELSLPPMPNFSLSGDDSDVNILPVLKYALVRLKLSRIYWPNLKDLKNSWDIYSLSNRVDILSHLLSQADKPLQMELFQLLSKSSNAFPFIINSTLSTNQEEKSYICFQNYLLNLPKLPKILACLRIGENYEGKSKFLNEFILLNKKAFASKSKTAPKTKPASKPKFLDGFVDSVWLNEANSDPIFWSELKRRLPLNSNIQKDISDSILLLNVHGDALAQPFHLHFLKMICSSFLIFWMPQPYFQIQSKRLELEEILKPHHFLNNLVQLYVDPAPDTMRQINQTDSLRSPFISHPTSEEKDMLEYPHNSLNAANAAKAFSIAISYPPKDISALSETENKSIIAFDSPSKLIIPSYHQTAVDLSNLIQKLSFRRVKTSLYLQQRNFINKTDFLDYWKISPDYAQIIGAIFEILCSHPQENSTEEVWIDLADLLSSNSAERAVRKGLNGTIEALLSMSESEWGLPLIQKQNKIQRVTNEAEDSSLSVMDLLIEACKVVDLCPELIKHRFEPLPNMGWMMGSLFLNKSHSLPIPFLDNKFFKDPWASQMLTYFKNNQNPRVFVLNCIGINSGDVTKLLCSLFGIDFTFPRDGGNYNISGLQMRLIQFDVDLQRKSGLKGILLIQSRNICKIDNQLDKEEYQIYQKLVTLLLISSNMTWILDFERNSDFKCVLEMALLALNKKTLNSNQSYAIPKLVFIGMNKTIDKADITDFLSNVQSAGLSTNDYSNNSSLFFQIASRAIQDIENGEGIQNLGVNQDSGKEIQTLENLLKQIQSHSLETRVSCPYLIDWCINLQSLWEFTSKIPFPYPNLEMMEKEMEFEKKLSSVEAFVDNSFLFHVAEIQRLIYKEMREIYKPNSTEPNSDEMIETKKDILFLTASAFFFNIFDHCVLGGDLIKSFNLFAPLRKPLSSKTLSNKIYIQEEANICKDCQLKTDSQNSYLKELDPEKQKIFKMKIETYANFERIHFLNIIQQLIFSMEIKITLEAVQFENQNQKLKQIKNTKESILTPKQILSLKRKVISSQRRMQEEINKEFPSAQILIEELIKSDANLFDLAGKNPAFEYTEQEEEYLYEDELYLNWAQTVWLNQQIMNLLSLIPATTMNGLYHNGIIRKLKSDVESVLTELQNLNSPRHLIQSFKLALIKFTIGETYKLIEISEARWNQDFDPMILLKKSRA